MSDKITVMLVDDEHLEREGLKLMLKKNRPNVEVIVEARDGRRPLTLLNNMNLI
ncbi:MAG: hypothetical protein LRY73_02515 [Bacillus sp. (in: Bacteria)]|nr:hypothetical protein [Bacillus sp. (in: firmicutes)]